MQPGTGAGLTALLLGGPRHGFARSGSDVRVFDRIIVVDWSARAVPATGRDSVWIAVAEPDRVATTINPPTRAAAIDALERSIVGREGGTLLTIDASLGFPVGTARALGLDAGPAWQSIWTELGRSIDDHADNANNRFAVAATWNERVGGGPGPFWGCPPSACSPSLTSTKPPRRPTDPPEWRACEVRLRAAGRRPFSCWQLLGAGSVASQSLLAIAAFGGLRRRLAKRDVSAVEVEIWPFTTGLRPPASADTDGSYVVLAECWPSLFVAGAGADDGRVRDERQVVETAEALRRADGSGELIDWFRPRVDADTERAAVDEEAWILGVG